MDTSQTTYFRAAFRYFLKHSAFKNQKAVAAAAGIAESTLSEMMSKKAYSTKTQEKIAGVFGYNLLDFLSFGRKIHEGEAPLRNRLVIQVRNKRQKALIEEGSELYRGIPLYTSGKLAAGENGVIFDPYEQPDSAVILCQQELTGRKNHNLIALRVGGTSMSPLIPKGSAVVIDLDDRRLVNNRIYAVNYPSDGENIAAVKRVQKWKHGFVLLSSSPDFSPELSELDWKDLCVGRAVWVCRSLEDM